jgi:hypothetical protein
MAQPYRATVQHWSAGYICIVGEAIPQLTGRSDYSVRGFSICTAMIVSESKPNDVLTTLQEGKTRTSFFRMANSLLL